MSNYVRNSEAYRERRRKRKAGLRARALAKLGNKCSNPACQWLNPDGSRGCADPRCLQIDHVHGGGCAERLKNGTSQELLHYAVLRDETSKYQLLCANCNWIKRETNGETTRLPPMQYPLPFKG